MSAKVGDRAKFVGHDTLFHEGEREGKMGTIAADATLNTRGSNFGGGTCMWKVDGEDGVFVTALSDLEILR